MKYKTEQYAKESGKFQTVTPINAAWYLENFLAKEIAPAFGGFPFFPDDEGYLSYKVPHWGGDNRVPYLSITDDYGDIVHGVFLDPTRWKGQVIQAMSDMITFDELAANFEESKQLDILLLFFFLPICETRANQPQSLGKSLGSSLFSPRGRHMTLTECQNWRTSSSCLALPRSREGAILALSRLI